MSQKTYKQFEYQTRISFEARVASLRYEKRIKIKEFMKDFFRNGKLSNDIILKEIGNKFGHNTKLQVKDCLSDEIEESEEETELNTEKKPKRKSLISIIFGR